jgi:pimeloyl-ACP methyl ester carboxylesterase
MAPGEKEKRRAFAKVRALKALVHDAVDATTRLVDVGHESTSRGVRRVAERIEPLDEPVRLIDGVRRLSTRSVLWTIRAVNRVVEALTDGALEVLLPEDAPSGAVPALPLRSDVVTEGRWLADAAIGLLNAAVGDYLESSTNALDMGMVFRARDRYLALEAARWAEHLPNATPKVALFVHGLGTTEWSWCLEAEGYHGDPTVHFGALLEADRGFTPVHVRYNTGRRVSRNGRDLALALERFLAAYPVPIEDLTLIGHSMGGLVLRSAAHYGLEARHRWTTKVRRAFYLGSPHQGAPLAQLGHSVTGILEAVDHPATKIIGAILGRRSAGIHDLRYGALLDEDWMAEDPRAMSDAELLPGVQHCFVSATLTEDPRHPLGAWIGDLLVRDGSAGRPREARFPIDTHHYGGVLHHQLQNHPGIYAQLLQAIAERH